MALAAQPGGHLVDEEPRVLVLAESLPEQLVAQGQAPEQPGQALGIDTVLGHEGVNASELGLLDGEESPRSEQEVPILRVELAAGAGRPGDQPAFVQLPPPAMNGLVGEVPDAVEAALKFGGECLVLELQRRANFWNQADALHHVQLGAVQVVEQNVALAPSGRVVEAALLVVIHDAERAREGHDGQAPRLRAHAPP